jgi:hypothetical protein
VPAAVCPQKHLCVCVCTSGTYFYYRLSQPQWSVRLEGLGKLGGGEINDLIGDFLMATQKCASPTDDNALSLL